MKAIQKFPKLPHRFSKNPNVGNVMDINEEITPSNNNNLNN
jgi:hypothetical protein